MGFWEILLLGVALSMDACAVAMTNGMTNPKASPRDSAIVALFFGAFQFLMPIIGYFITGAVADVFIHTFEKISAWTAFALLAFLGVKMLFEGIKEWKTDDKATEQTDEACMCSTIESENPKAAPLTLARLTIQAIATSIDALAVGVTLKMATFTETGLALGAWGASAVIGVTTFLLSFGAVYVGKAVGNKLAGKAGTLGGVVLLGIGVKILMEALF